jgi:hypothetical protein
MVPSQFRLGLPHQRIEAIIPLKALKQVGARRKLMGEPGASTLHDRLSPGARALLGFLRSDAGAAAAARVRDLPPHLWDEALNIALQHGVAPLLHRALQSGDALAVVPEHVRVRLKEERRATGLLNLRRYAEFRRIAQALRMRNIPLIALKGLHLADLVYRDISLRPMSDLDILVPRPQLAQTLATLRELDYGFDGDFSGALDAILDTRCDVELRHRQMQLPLEVHWSLLAPPSRYGDVLDDVWRSAARARPGDADALVMSPAFALLHICAHLTCNHVFDFSLRALCDIAAIVRAHPELDWSAFVDHGRRHGWGRGVAAALRLACEHLGAAVPADVLAALGADVLDAAMLAEAMQHLLASGEMPDGLNHAANLMAFAGKRGAVEKLSALWTRTFVPRAELALTYGVPQDSARLSFYYAVRVKDLLQRYAASVLAMNVSDPRLAAVAARHARLAKWIAAG